MFSLSLISKRSIRNARLISYMFEKYGAVEEVLKPKDVKPAEPKENQVACKMLAAPMDQTDLASVLINLFKCIDCRNSACSSFTSSCWWKSRHSCNYRCRCWSKKYKRRRPCRLYKTKLWNLVS